MACSGALQLQADTVLSSIGSKTVQGDPWQAGDGRALALNDLCEAHGWVLLMACGGALHVQGDTVLSNTESKTVQGDPRHAGDGHALALNDLCVTHGWCC